MLSAGCFQDNRWRKLKHIISGSWLSRLGENKINRMVWKKPAKQLRKYFVLFTTLYFVLFTTLYIKVSYFYLKEILYLSGGTCKRLLDSKPLQKSILQGRVYWIKVIECMARSSTSLHKSSQTHYLIFSPWLVWSSKHFFLNYQNLPRYQANKFIWLHILI